MKIFKGASELNQTEGIQVYGSRQRSLFVEAYSGTNSAVTCGVYPGLLVNGKVYLITGEFSSDAKLRVSMCSWIEEWSQVSQRQRLGARRFYAPNCDCQISQCYWHDCPKLKGCNTSNLYRDPTSHDCKWRHSYCLKNTNGTACAWQETAEYKNCSKNNQGLP